MNAVQLARALLVSGRYAEAEPIARLALTPPKRYWAPNAKITPPSAVAQVCLAEILRQTGRYTEAEPLYR